MSGRVLTLGESQYRFGVGPILVRDIRVRQQIVVDDALWWHIEAEVANGTADSHGGWLRRELYVEDTALPRAAGPPP